MGIEIPIGLITIEPSEYPALLKPVTLHVSMYEDMIDSTRWIGWIGENEKLGIRCCVSSRFFPRSARWNIRKLKKEIIDDIDFIVDMYLVQKAQNAPPGSRRTIDAWIKYADPSKYPGKEHWYIEEMVEQ